MNLKANFKIFVRFTLVLSIGLSPLVAQKRPTIALVLSGGGARGGAHVGILKVLEEKKIPIDFIVGTSMGAFVGGLYASGKSPQEIETLLTTTDWTKYIRTDYAREDIPMRKKEVEYQYQGRLGVGIDVDNNIVLPTGVLKRQAMLLKFEEDFEHVDKIKDFDLLAIPFRAVATNIENGEAVVLKSGSLAKSIYASSSIPGGFQPINIDGKDLVDGGVSDNMPIGVAREMGADIIIAVDVSEKFEKDLNVNSYFVVMGQLVNILMRKNANQSIATLRKKDILLRPNLEGFGGLDADKYKEIIQRGVAITHTMYKSKLEHLSLSKEEYALFQKNHTLVKQDNNQVIDSIVINNPTYISDTIILKGLRLKVGSIVDKKELREDILHIYNTGIFDKVDYQFIYKNNKNILEITTTPSWDNHGEIRFALGLEDDLDGHSTYSFKFGYTMFGLNKYGGEWKNDFEIGKRELAYSELYQPLSSRQIFYIKPYFKFRNISVAIPATTLGLVNTARVETDLQRYGGGLNLGMHLFRSLEFELGAGVFKDSVGVDTLAINNHFEARPITTILKIDNLDNLNFPNTGIKSKVILTKEMKDFGSDYNYEQFYMDVEKPFTLYNHTLTAYLKYGTTNNKERQSSLAGLYTLGGLFNLSGFVPYSLANENMALGVIKYRYRIKDGGFFGSLNAPLYAGFSAEIGNVWDSKDSVSYDMMHKSGTIYIAADTIFGPFHFAYGFSEGKEKTAYLYLGEKF